MGARPDDAHAAGQHIEELWQFIDAGGAQQPADPSDPIIVPAGRLAAVGIAAVGAHRSKLVHAEQPVPPPNALLNEEYGAAAVDLDRQRHDQHQRRQEREGGEHEDQIEHPLGKDVDRGRQVCGMIARIDRGGRVGRPRAVAGVNLPVDRRALEDETPVVLPFGRARDRHPIDVLEQCAEPIEHHRIGDVGRDACRVGVKDHIADHRSVAFGV